MLGCIEVRRHSLLYLLAPQLQVFREERMQEAAVHTGGTRMCSSSLLPVLKCCFSLKMVYLIKTRQLYDA